MKPLGPILIVLVIFQGTLSSADDPLPPVTARVAGAQVMEIKIDDEGRKNVLLNRGSKHGLKTGDRFAIVRKEKRIGVVKVFAVFEDFSSATLVSELKDVEKNDVAVRLKKPPEPPQQGLILLAPRRTDKVEFSRGTLKNIYVGKQLGVYRNGQYFALLEIVKFNDKGVTGRYLSGNRSNFRRRQFFKVGDIVREQSDKKARADKSTTTLKAKRLMAQAEELRAKARRLEAESSRLRRKASQLEDQASKLNAGIKKSPSKAVAIPELGIEVSSSKVFATGVEIVKVLAGSVGAKGGLKLGEVIYLIDDDTIDSSADLIKFIKALPAGQSAKITVMGKDGSRVLKVRVKG
jgi:hypothetical protein